MANILIADDDLIVLKVVRNILVKAGHTVMQANNGLQALELLELQDVDLIVSDANMPGGVSGFNLVATIRQDAKFKNIPFIFLTARRDKSDVLKAMHFGANDYVVKPVKPEVLVSKVEAILSAKKTKSNAG